MCNALSIYQCRPTQFIDLGETHVEEAVFRDFMREIGPRFTQATYNLLTWNCNNFTNEASKFLLGRGIPKRKHQSTHARCVYIQLFTSCSAEVLLAESLAFACHAAL
jgi:ankyrin repeat protein